MYLIITSNFIFVQYLQSASALLCVKYYLANTGRLSILLSIHLSIYVCNYSIYPKKGIHMYACVQGCG